MLSGLLEGRTESELRLLYSVIGCTPSSVPPDSFPDMRHIQDHIWEHLCSMFHTLIHEKELVWIKTGDDRAMSATEVNL